MKKSPLGAREEKNPFYLSFSSSPISGGISLGHQVVFRGE